MSRRALFSDEEILGRARNVFVDQGYAARSGQVAEAVGHIDSVVCLLAGE